MTIVQRNFAQIDKSLPHRNLGGKVLILGDDMRIFLTLCRSFGRRNLEVHAVPFAAEPPALSSKYINAIHEIPHHDADPVEWRKRMQQLVAEHDFDLIVPCTDAAIFALHKNRDLFDDHALAIPNQMGIDHFFDKQVTHELARKLRIPVAKFHQLGKPTSEDSLLDEFELPFVIKPTRTFWPGKDKHADVVEIVESREQLSGFLDSLQLKERYSAEAYFEGDGVGISVLAQNGKISQAFQHRRLREGRGGSSSYRISETLHPEMLRAVEKLCDYTSYSGVCMFEFRQNADTGQWILLEVNARFWGSMALPVALGVDFPNLLYDQLVFGSATSPISYPPGRRCRNLVLDGYNLLGQSSRLSLMQFPGWVMEVISLLMHPVNVIFGREHSDSLAFDDIYPAIAELLHAPVVVWRKISRRKKAGPEQLVSKNQIHLLV